MCNTPGFSGKKPAIEQSGVAIFQRCFPQNPGKFCTLINSMFWFQVKKDRTATEKRFNIVIEIIRKETCVFLDKPAFSTCPF